MGLYEALPDGFTDQTIDDLAAKRLRQASDTAIEKLKSAAQYIYRPDHTPTYGGLLKLGFVTSVAGVLALVPGVALITAIPAVNACLYGKEAAKGIAALMKSTQP